MYYYPAVFLYILLIIFPTLNVCSDKQWYPILPLGMHRVPKGSPNDLNMMAYENPD